MTAKYDFTGYLALVTGGGSGLGRAVAQALAEGGAVVIAADINIEGATETVQGLKGKEHIALKVDVSSESSVNELSNAITSKYTRSPSIVIHAAGILAAGKHESVFEIKFAEVNRSIDVNLKGTFLINKVFGQRMRDDKIEHGSIVNFSSAAGRQGIPFIADYCASKAGVNSLTESFGKELAGVGIRVNAVAPFYMPTPMLDGFEHDKVLKHVATSPSKRMGQVEEVVKVCLFLASKDSSYVNAQIVHITGGF